MQRKQQLITEKKLAHVINEIYVKEKRNVIIMGHSLGTRLINNTLPYIKNDNILLTIPMAGATPNNKLYREHNENGLRFKNGAFKYLQ